MVTINILHLSAGHSIQMQSAMPEALGLANNDEINRPVDIIFDIDKVGTEHYINASFNTVAHLICDRCAEIFDSIISESVRIILTNDKSLLDQDDVYKVNDGTSEVDVTESISQSMLLAFPTKKLCSDNCKGLCPRCGLNLNLNNCSCLSKEIDPRWDGLKKLLDN